MTENWFAIVEASEKTLMLENRETFLASHMLWSTLLVAASIWVGVRAARKFLAGGPPPIFSGLFVLCGVLGLAHLTFGSVRVEVDGFDREIRLSRKICGLLETSETLPFSDLHLLEVRNIGDPNGQAGATSARWSAQFSRRAGDDWFVDASGDSEYMADLTNHLHRVTRVPVQGNVFYGAGWYWPR